MRAVSKFDSDASSFSKAPVYVGLRVCDNMTEVSLMSHYKTWASVITSKLPKLFVTYKGVNANSMDDSHCSSLIIVEVINWGEMVIKQNLNPH